MAAVCFAPPIPRHEERLRRMRGDPPPSWRRYSDRCGLPCPIPSGGRLGRAAYLVMLAA